MSRKVHRQILALRNPKEDSFKGEEEGDVKTRAMVLELIKEPSRTSYTVRIAPAPLIYYFLSVSVSFLLAFLFF